MNKLVLVTTISGKASISNATKIRNIGKYFCEPGSENGRIITAIRQAKLRRIYPNKSID